MARLNERVSLFCCACRSHFANIKVPQAALSSAQKAEIIHRVTNLFVEYMSEAARPHTMVLIEEVPDGGYGRADEVFVIPDAYRATS